MARTRQTVSVDELSTFGARLRFIRDQKDISRTKLADMVGNGVTARIIGHIESGENSVSLDRAFMLAEALEVDQKWLFHGEPAENDNEPEALQEADIDEPVDLDESAQSAKSTLNPSIKPVSSMETDDNRLELQQAQKGQKAFSPTDTFFNQMNDILDIIEALRLDSFANHSRKMPVLINKASELAGYLELNDLDEISEDREISFKALVEVFADDADDADDTPSSLIEYAAIEDTDEDELQKIIKETIERIIDTAILGTDLYTEDMDDLKLFARKHDIESGHLLGWWHNHYHIVRRVRSEYRNQALKGKIECQVKLKQKG